MNQSVRTIRVIEESGPVLKLIDALSEMPGVLVSAEEMSPCAVCSNLTPRVLLAGHAHIDGKICPMCQESAESIETHFYDANKRSMAEFWGQLPQLIRDRRNGAEEPTFYRGFE